MAKKKPPKRAGTKFALCVGINNYPGTGSDLSGCVNDAKDWQKALQKRGYQVTTLLDAKATASAIRKELQVLITSAKPGHSLVFTFSGHGSWLPDQNGDDADARDEMLCPYDVDSGGYLIDDELAQIFGRKPLGANLYFLSDSCHSGTVSKFMPSLIPKALRARMPRPRFLPPEAFLKGKRAAAARRIATLIRTPKQKYPALLAAGCRDLEFSYDASFGGRPNGAFTYYALRALAGKPATPAKWMARIKKSLPTSVHPQTPSLYGASAAKTGKMF